MKTEKNTVFNIDFNARKFRLKCDYEIKSLRLRNAVANPESRAIVHKALTGEVICGTMSQEAAANYYLAARQQDYDDADKAYDDILNEGILMDMMK